MSVSLSKGGNVSLSKEAPGLRAVLSLPMMAPAVAGAASQGTERPERTEGACSTARTN